MPFPSCVNMATRPASSAAMHSNRAGNTTGLLGATWGTNFIIWLVYRGLGVLSSVFVFDFGKPLSQYV